MNIMCIVEMNAIVFIHPNWQAKHNEFIYKLYSIQAARY